MQFTGQRLALIRQALEWAVENREDEIGRHPAPLKYPDDIEQLEEDIEQLRYLIHAIDLKGGLE